MPGWKSGLLSCFTGLVTVPDVVPPDGLVTADGFVAGFTDVPEGRTVCPEGRTVCPEGRTVCPAGRTDVLVTGFTGFVTVVLGLLPVVLPGFLSVDVLTAGRVADLTPELLETVAFDLVCFEADDTDLEPDVDRDDGVDLDTDVEVDLDVPEVFPTLLACAKASD